MFSEEDLFEGEGLLSQGSLGSTPLEFSDVATGTAPAPTTSRVAPEGRGPFNCPVCRKEIKTKAGFNRHIMVHTLNDYAFRIPVEEQIHSQLPQIFKQVYTEIISEPSVLDHKTWTVNLIHALSDENRDSSEFRLAVSTPVIKCILEKTKVLPAAQFEEALKRHNILMCDAVYLQELKAKLLSSVPEDMKECPNQVTNRLLWRISSLVLYKIQEFVFQQMKQQHLNASKNFVMSESDRGEFFIHVGKLLRAAFKFGMKADNSVWKMRCHCLKERFVVAQDTLNSDQFVDLKLWEDKYVSMSQPASELFLGLERILQSFQESGTPFSIDAVLGAFPKPENLFILNHMRELSQGILSEELAIDLLKDLTKSLSSLSWRLEARKRVEEAKKKQSTSNVSLRTNLKRNPKPSAESEVTVPSEEIAEASTKKAKGKQTKAAGRKGKGAETKVSKESKEKTTKKESTPPQQPPQEKLTKEKTTKKKLAQEKLTIAKTSTEKPPAKKKPSSEEHVQLRTSSRSRKPTDRYNL